MKDIFTIYKPKGPTSYDMIAQVKKATGESRVGHAGTLDPLAEGVLVVGVGRDATRQLEGVVKKEKEYIADIKLGVTSETDDEEGIKTKTKNVKSVKLSEVKEVIEKFIGIVDQVPPIYSAIKVSGQRAYKAARKGQELKLAPRKVEIKSIKILKYKYPNLKIRVITGRGVYIRSLARDIGKALGTGGYMSDLKRERVGKFKASKAIDINRLSDKYLKRRIKILRNRGIGVIPTDTIYGLVGMAVDNNTVERIYKVRKRQPDKPFIILISSISDLKKFGVVVDDKTKNILKKYWPGKISIILPCSSKLKYLHRGTNTLAFRLPSDLQLLQLLNKTGPLVAPSANLEGKKPAITIKQAKKYFGDQVDFYFDQGKYESESSTLIKIENGEIITLRNGAVKI
jgi:tRNA pseudouridine55 synthase